MLSEAQSDAPQGMYTEQQRDRDALRKAHEAQKLEHQNMGEAALRRRAQQPPFETVKEQYAGQWQAVRDIANLKDARKSRRRVETRESKSYAIEATNARSPPSRKRTRPGKRCLAGQEKERLDLRTPHRQETAALARQQIAERFGVHEKWRARHLDLRPAASMRA